MTNIETQLLLLILAEQTRVERLAGLNKLPWDAGYHARLAVDDFRAGRGIRVCGEWIGTDAASRQARRRGLKSLERSGLATLFAAWGRAITHVLLTDQGREVAEELATRPTAVTTGPPQG